MKKLGFIKVKFNKKNINQKSDTILDEQEKYITKLKRGVAMAETVLIIGISLVVIVSVFYPVFKSLISDSMNNLVSWFNSAIASIGMV